MVSDPVLLITGGSRGIGAATARLAAERGYTVCVNYKSDQQAASETVAQIGKERAFALQADISIEADVVRMFAQLNRIDALVNNAATLETQMRLDQMDAARITRVFATNVLGAFLCAREAVRRMSTRHGGTGGAIVNVSSGAARAGSPGEYVDYAASKGALDTMTIGLVTEVAEEGIRVNGVRPGFIYFTPRAENRIAWTASNPWFQCSAAGSPKRWQRQSCGYFRQRRRM